MAEQKLRYVITGDATGLNGALNRASTRLKTFGQGIKNVGASLQRIAIPLAIAGGAAIKMGVDFDKSMTKIKSLVGLAGDDVDAMSGKVREMARETGVSSSKAANALFFITSAGLEGEQAMAVLNASLKASAVGLGDVATVADLSTSAMNAYSESGLTASQATDVLTAAVREGKLNSEELAGSMGQVLPIASQMGVSFNDVGAAMAAMSRTGTTAAIGATQLRGMLSGLLKPTVQAEQALASMGLSSGGLKQQIQDEGLLSVLATLKEKFDQNSDAAAQVFPNIKALSGVLNLTGDNADKAREIFEKLNKTNNDTQVAFDKTSQSASFRLTKALNTARESFAQMGAVLLETLLPLFQKITGAITNLFDRFNNLDSATQKIVAGVGVLVIALPTLLSLFGTLTTIVGALLSPVGLIAAALAGVAFIIYKNWNEVLPVLVGIFNQFVEIFNASKLLRIAIFGIGSVFKSVFIGIKLLVDQFVNTFVTMWNVIKEFSEKGFKGSFGDVLKDGFDNSIELTKKAGQDIATTFTDDFASALDAKLEKTTVDAVQGTLTSVGDKFKGFFTGLTTGFGGGGGQRQRQESVLTGTNIGQKDNTGLLLTPVGQENTEKATEKVSVFKNLLDAVGNSAAVVGEGIKGAFHGAFQSMMQGENVFKALGKMLLDLIKKLIAAALAAFVLSTLIGGLGLGGSGGAFEGMDKFGSLFTQFSGVKMAKGGIVSTPTMGLMGEYPGARSNPEVIAPLDRLKSMIGDTGSSKVQVGGQFTLRGQDLVVALQRANRNRDRIN
jgi:TP901 family phage tail tape measure protein